MSCYNQYVMATTQVTISASELSSLKGWWVSTAEAVLGAMNQDTAVEVDSIGAGDKKIESVRDELGGISLHNNSGIAWSGSANDSNPLDDWGVEYDPETIDSSASTYTQQLAWTLFYGEWQPQLCDTPGGTDSLSYPVIL